MEAVLFLMWQDHRQSRQAERFGVIQPKPDQSGWPPYGQKNESALLNQELAVSWQKYPGQKNPATHNAQGTNR